MFFVQHWGVLVFVVGCLIIYSAYAPAIRVPVLIAAAVEKFALGLLVFFGPVRRTSGMTTSAVVDAVFAILSCCVSCRAIGMSSQLAHRVISLRCGI